MKNISVSSTTVAIVKKPRSLSKTLVMVSDTEFDYTVHTLGSSVISTCPDLTPGDGVVFNPKKATKYTLEGQVYYFVDCSDVYAWYKTES